MKTIQGIIKEVFDSYDFENSAKDELLKTDILASIEEAYMLGCVHAGLDNEIYLHACQYLKKSSGIEAVRLIKIE